MYSAHSRICKIVKLTHKSAHTPQYSFTSSSMCRCSQVNPDFASRDWGETDSRAAHPSCQVAHTDVKPDGAKACCHLLLACCADCCCLPSLKIDVASHVCCMSFSYSKSWKRLSSGSPCSIPPKIALGRDSCSRSTCCLSLRVKDSICSQRRRKVGGTGRALPSKKESSCTQQQTTSIGFRPIQPCMPHRQATADKVMQ